MNICLAVHKLVPQADYNPACFDFSEEEARKNLLWRDERPMPTMEQLLSVKAEVDSELAVEDVRNKRREAYELAGLHIEKFTEMIIEDDQEGMQAFRDARLVIKQKHPKP